MHSVGALELGRLHAFRWLSLLGATVGQPECVLRRGKNIKHRVAFYDSCLFANILSCCRAVIYGGNRGCEFFDFFLLFSTKEHYVCHLLAQLLIIISCMLAKMLTTNHGQAQVSRDARQPLSFCEPPPRPPWPPNKFDRMPPNLIGSCT
jgi:hypothetical protein